MKNLFSIILLLSFIFINSDYVSSQSKKSEKIKSVLLNLFEYCANDDYSNASKYLAYSGEDSTRRWSDLYDYSNDDDKKDIVALCNEIKNIVGSGGEFEFVEFSAKKEKEGEWLVWRIDFQSGNKKKVYFACLKIKGIYALGDID